MGREDELLRLELQLLQDFAHVAMPEDRVGREIVRHLDEMRCGARLLAGPGDARLRIADYAWFELDQPTPQQRSQRENDGGGVAAGIGDQLRLGQPLTVQFRQAVDGLVGELCCCHRVCVLEAVDGAVLCPLEPPRPAQVDHPQTAANRLRHPLARDLVRRR